jgi:hypothetical protein
VVFQLEADGGLEMFELPRPDLDVESVPLVRDFYNLRPGETVDPQPVPMKKFYYDGKAVI